MAGRNPDPSAIKRLKGVAKDRMPKREPTVPVGLPPPPARFSNATAKQAFIRYGDVLVKMGVLTVADGGALARLAECHAQVALLQQDVANHGHTYLGPAEWKDGKKIPNSELVKARPEVAMLADADRRLLAYLSAFGLTPSSRTKVQVNPLDPKKGAVDGAEFFS